MEHDVATPRTHATEEQDDDETVHELVDITAEEVSDVDRAANRRTYLVVKRDGDTDEDMLDPAFVEEDDALTAMDKAAADEDEGDEDEDDEDDEEDAKPASAARARRRKQALVLPSPVKRALLGAATGALRRLTALVTAIKDAEESSARPGGPLPDAVARELRGICEALTKLVARYPAPAAKADTTVAIQRQAELQDTIELLQTLLAEALPQEPAAAPPGATPSIATPTAKRAHGSPDNAQALTDTLASIAVSLKALTDRVQGQEAEIARLKKSTGLPASREVDAVRAPRPPEPVSWPMDMNQPLTREQVAKDISFFEND